MEHMTARVSCFSRAYHYRNNQTWIFRDDFAEKILGEEEYCAIAESMAQGVQFFAPGFRGNQEQAIRLVVDYHLSPSVLGRSAFNEMHLKNEIRLGAKQYVLFAAGYDTYAFRNSAEHLAIYELDLPQMIEDKLRREKRSGLEAPANRVMVPCDLSESSWKKSLIQQGFRSDIKSFGSLLGISYYLDKVSFARLMSNISDLFCKGSAICFDYPVKSPSAEMEKTELLAKGANEEMKAKYEYEEMERLLAEHDFLVYEHLDAGEMTRQYFEEYNGKAGASMSAPNGVEYILAVKK